MFLNVGVIHFPRWYRAKILSSRPEREFDVFFVDYGDREWVSLDRIAPMRPDYLKVRQFLFMLCSVSIELVYMEVYID